MRPERAVVLLFSLGLLTTSGLAGCLDGSGPEDEVEEKEGRLVDAHGLSPRLTDGWTFETFTHELDPTIQIHGEVYLPDPEEGLPGRELAEAHPTVLMASPYLGAGLQGEVPDIPFFSFLLENLTLRGYAIAFVGSASTGGTGGCWDFMGPIDQQVAVGAVEAVTSQPWSDGKVGMIGVSYDAMTQIMAASNVADGLVTIVPISPLTHAYAGLYQGGVHYGGDWWTTTTFYHQIALTPPGTNQERLPGWAQSVALTPTCIPENTVFGNDPTGTYNEYFQERDFRPKASDVEASVFFMHGFKDANTKPDNPFPWYNDLETDKKLWLGHWAHSPGNASWSGREDMYLTVHRWFDHYLMGVENGIDQELGVEVQDSLGRWRHEAQWPPADSKTLSLHPDQGGSLSPTPGSGSVSFGGPASATPANVGASEFRTQPLDESLHVAGIPTLDLEVSSDRTGGQVIAEVHLIREDGKGHLVTRGALNLHFPQGPSPSPEPLVPLDGVQATLELYPTDFILEEGAQLQLTLLTQDPSGWYHADPHLAQLTLSFGEETALKLPIVERDDEKVLREGCGLLLDDWAACQDKNLKDL